MNGRKVNRWTVAVMAGMVAGAALGGCGASGRAGKSIHSWEHLGQAFKEIEARHGGRLGVAVLDTQTGMQMGHRAEERFAMCSTFKLLAVAATLARVDAGQEQLDRRVFFTSDGLMSHSPICQNFAGDKGMTVKELCAAAMTVSDNTAANLLLQGLGGPGGVTIYARLLGDRQTRLDRVEPELNEATPGDPRDTTTPAAMLEDLRQLTLGKALSEESRDLLLHWLLTNQTGDARLRAGIPHDWTAGEKTGSGEHGAANDVGILWPPGRKPLLICVYSAESKQSGEERSAAIAAVARSVVAGIDR